MNDIIQIKRKLKKTWPIFFARYGGNLFDVQARTIPLVLNGENVIIASPTASGKTEAVIAPIIESILNNPSEGLRVLYVVPTKALCNDLYYRLFELLQQIEIKIDLQTGDKHGFTLDNPPDILITTPESMDSLICRHPEALGNINFIILDEIHLLDNTHRGDQLRILIRRLGQLTKQVPRFYALSATLYNPIEIASRYFTEPKLVTAAGSREIKYMIFDKIGEAVDAASNNGFKKLLIFCNYRAEVEDLSAECAKFYPSKKIVVHHGKLDKKVREDAELFMKESPSGICIATMTLEIGIDIGDIDAVILYGVPWSVSSLLQRVGRGNRRKKTIVAYGICKEEQDRSSFKEMFDLANQGFIEHTNYQFDYSIIIQQIFSCLFATRTGILEQSFLSIFSDFCTPDQLKLILSNLAEKEWIEYSYEKWFAKQKVMDLGDKGYIHSNISNTQDYSVVDGNSGASLGSLSMVLTENTFRLAGKSWKVIRTEGTNIYVVPTSQAASTKFSISSRKSAYYYLLPPELK